MSELKRKLKVSIITMIVSVLMACAFISLYGISWIFTCGLIKLITFAFGLNFSWIAATAIWLAALFILKMIRIEGDV